MRPITPAVRQVLHYPNMDGAKAMALTLHTAPMQLL